MTDGTGLRARDRVGTGIAVVATVMGIWLGLVAPSVSPVAPAPASSVSAPSPAGTPAVPAAP